MHYFSTSHHLFGPLFLTPIEDSVASVISARLVAVQKLWEKTQPHPRGVAGWVNTFIAAHIPAYQAASANAKLSLTEIYRQKLNPETVPACDLITPHDFGCEHELYKVWGLRSPGNHKLNSTVLKLFFKGAPHPTSIRYCGGQIKKCASLTGRPEKIVRSMLLAHALSLYRFCDRVEPWPVFARLISRTTLELVEEFCANQTCKQLYMIITKWIVDVSQQNTPLHVQLKQMPEQSAHLASVVDGQICLAARPAYTAAHMHKAVVKTMRLRSKIPPSVLQTLGPTETLRVFRDIVRTPHAYGPHHLTNVQLKLAKMSASAIKRVNALPAGPYIPSAKVVRALVTSLDHADRARLYLTLHAVQHRCGFPRRHYLGDGVYADMRARAQSLFGVTEIIAFVCLWCNEWRSHLRSYSESTASKAQKLRNGITLSIDSSVGSQCSCCLASDGIASIDMVGSLVTIGNDRTTIALCYECLAPCTNPHIIGTLPYCNEHFKAAMSVRQGTCICGAINDGPAQLLLDAKGAPVVCRFCPEHVKDMPDTTRVRVGDICKRLKLG